LCQEEKYHGHSDRIKERIEETIKSKVGPKRERKNSFSGKLKKRKDI
jgi:hypothetical protein